MRIGGLYRAILCVAGFLFAYVSFGGYNRLHADFSSRSDSSKQERKELKEIRVPDHIRKPVEELIKYQRGYDRYDVAKNQSQEEEYTFFRHLYDSNYESFSKLIPILPAHLKKVVDIGCGLAMYDIFVYRHYHEIGQEITMYYVDQTRVQEPSRYGFENDQYEFYNSLEWSREIAVYNGVPSSAIETVNATKDNIAKLHDVDLVYSMVSWGFHYPIDLYLKVVFEALKPGGILYVELRKAKKAWMPQLELLQKQFGDNCSIVDKTQRKLEIVACTK